MKITRCLYCAMPPAQGALGALAISFGGGWIVATAISAGLYAAVVADVFHARIKALEEAA